MDDVLKSVHYDPNELVEGPSRRRQNPQSDAAEALKALLTQQRNLPTYLDGNLKRAFPIPNPGPTRLLAGAGELLGRHPAQAAAVGGPGRPPGAGGDHGFPHGFGNFGPGVLQVGRTGPGSGNW